MSLVSFEKNRHGHIIVSVTGVRRTGAEEIQRLRTTRVQLPDPAKLAFMSEEYDKEHVLTDGATYNLVLLVLREFSAEERTPQMMSIKAQMWGYKAPPAGLASGLREVVPDYAIRSLDIDAIVLMHDGIRIGPERVPVHLAPNIGNGGDDRGNWLGAFVQYLDQYDPYKRAYAYLDPLTRSGE